MFLLAACSDRNANHDPVRIVDLLPTAEAERVVLAEGISASDETAATVAVDRQAAPIARLRVTGSGDAQLVRLSWKLAGERRFMPYRALTFPVQPGDEERTYDVDLRREPYWTGEIEAIRFATDQGRIEIASVEGLPGRGQHRLTSLKGLTVPSLPGAERFEVTLPSDLPREVTFEAWVGLLPRFQRPGVEATFRAGAEPAGGGEAVTWVETTLSGQAGEGGWQRLRQSVRVPAGGRLVLESWATRHGQPLPEGSAIWGAPALVPEGHLEESPAEPAGMNLLLVVVDTLRADLLGSYGGDGGLTPNLDELAGRAARFEQLHAPSPWTLPSMTTLLTGQPPEVHGAGQRIGDFAPTALGDSLPTLAGELATGGYYTAGAYNNIYMNPSFGLERGFDEYAWVDQEDDVIVDHALTRLEELRHRRLFLLVHLFGPHHPYAPPESDCRLHAEPFAPGYDPDPEQGGLGCAYERTDVPTLSGEIPAERDWRWIEGLYRAEVAHTDRQVGRLLAGLEQLGLASRTVVAVVSDHGEAFYDRLPQLDAHGYVQADHGHTHFEELLRVPGLVAVPGRPASVVEAPAELADVAPTLLGLVGLDPGRLTAGALSGDPEARDLRPQLQGAPPRQRPTLLAGRLLYGPSRWAVRRGPWKLVVPLAEGDGNGAAPDGAGSTDGAEGGNGRLAVELYNLQQDPEERRDVAGQHPEVARDLEALARRELEAREDLRRQLLAGDEDVLNSAYLEWNHITKLRALGYLK